MFGVHCISLHKQIVRFVDKLFELLLLVLGIQQPKKTEQNRTAQNRTANIDGILYFAEEHVSSMCTLVRWGEKTHRRKFIFIVCHSNEFVFSFWIQFFFFSIPQCANTILFQDIHSRAVFATHSREFTKLANLINKSREFHSVADNVKSMIRQ